MVLIRLEHICTYIMLYSCSGRYFTIYMVDCGIIHYSSRNLQHSHNVVLTLLHSMQQQPENLVICLSIIKVVPHLWFILDSKHFMLFAEICFNIVLRLLCTLYIRVKLKQRFENKFKTLQCGKEQKINLFYYIYILILH